MLKGEVGLGVVDLARRVNFKFLSEHLSEQLDLDFVFGVEPLRDEFWNRKLKLYFHFLHLNDAIMTLGLTVS